MLIQVVALPAAWLDLRDRLEAAAQRLGIELWFPATAEWTHLDYQRVLTQVTHWENLDKEALRWK